MPPLSFKVDPSHLLDANFLIDELAGQLLLPVRQLLKNRKPTDSALGFKSSHHIKLRKEHGVDTVLDICRSFHLDTPPQPLPPWSKKTRKSVILTQRTDA